MTLDHRSPTMRQACGRGLLCMIYFCSRQRSSVERERQGSSGRATWEPRMSLRTWQPSVMALPLREIQQQWTAAERRWAVPRALARRNVRRRIAAVGTCSPDNGPEFGKLIELQEIESAITVCRKPTLAMGRPPRGLPFRAAHTSRQRYADRAGTRRPLNDWSRLRQQVYRTDPRNLGKLYDKATHQYKPDSLRLQPEIAGHEEPFQRSIQCAESSRSTLAVRADSGRPV
jgi:hypothetical protein